MLKSANKQYSKIENDYEMTFTNETAIEPCHEADNLPHIVLNIVKLNELTNKNANDFVGGCFFFYFSLVLLLDKNKTICNNKMLLVWLNQLEM